MVALGCLKPRGHGVEYVQQARIAASCRRDCAADGRREGSELNLVMQGQRCHQYEVGQPVNGGQRNKDAIDMLRFPLRAIEAL